MKYSVNKKKEEKTKEEEKEEKKIRRRKKEGRKNVYTMMENSIDFVLFSLISSLMIGRTHDGESEIEVDADTHMYLMIGLIPRRLQGTHAAAMPPQRCMLNERSIRKKIFVYRDLVLVLKNTCICIRNYSQLLIATPKRSRSIRNSFSGCKSNN